MLFRQSGIRFAPLLLLGRNLLDAVKNFIAPLFFFFENTDLMLFTFPGRPLRGAWGGGVITSVASTFIDSATLTVGLCTSEHVVVPFTDPPPQSVG